MKLLGIDIGGTHATCAEVHTGSGAPVIGQPKRYDVDALASADVILNAWSAAIRDATDPTTVNGIGVAMPGPFDYARGVSYIKDVCKFDALYGMDVGQALRERLNLRDDQVIVFENDVNAFTLGEWLGGAACGMQRVLGMTLGTGFGSGFLVDGDIITEGAELPPDTTLGFVPYRDGIAEDYISRRGMLKAYRALGGDPAFDVAEIASAARDHDSNAVQVFTELGTMLAEVVQPFAESFRADIVVIGGSMTRSFDLFEDAFRAGFKSQAQVATARLLDTAGLLGAAGLAERRLV